MSSINLCFNNVSFSYYSIQKPIIDNLSLSFPAGWTGITGPNGIGKTTLVKLSIGMLKPHSGLITGIKPNITGLYCPQTTEFYPEFCNDFFESDDNFSGKIRSLLGIDLEWQNRWNSLSYGERKRVQISIMLWKNPDILALDEPTNHLDNYSSKIIVDALLTFKGIGLIISHDRMLLDILCKQCLFMNINNVILRPGDFSEGIRQQEIEETNKRRTYENSVENYKKLKSSAQKIKEENFPKEKQLSKRYLDKRDHDAKRKVDIARILGMDAVGSRKFKQMDQRAEYAKAESEKLYFNKRTAEGFLFTGETARCDSLLFLSGFLLPINNELELSIPDLIIKPTDRIRITGNNGAGKSTLIKYLITKIKLSANKVVYIPQETDNKETDLLLHELNTLNHDELGKLLTIIYRLGSEPERLLSTRNPSPGEIKKILLGLGLLKFPSLLIMDEPTNHMDYPSIHCLEEALLNFKGALLLVSHDITFIKNLTTIEWNITKMGKDSKLSFK